MDEGSAADSPNPADHFPLADHYGSTSPFAAGGFHINADNDVIVTDQADDEQLLLLPKNFDVRLGQNGERYMVKEEDSEGRNPPRDDSNHVALEDSYFLQHGNISNGALVNDQAPRHPQLQHKRLVQTSEISYSYDAGGQDTLTSPSVASASRAQHQIGFNHSDVRFDLLAREQDSYNALSRWAYQTRNEEPFPLAAAMSRPPLPVDQQRVNKSTTKHHHRPGKD